MNLNLKLPVRPRTPRPRPSMSSVDASASTSAHALQTFIIRDTRQLWNSTELELVFSSFQRCEPHARAGGRSGAGGSSSQAQSYGSHSHEHQSRSRSRSRVAGNQVFNRSNTDLNTPHAPSTPSKLIKRKNLGFVQLRMGLGGGGGIVNGVSSSVVDQGRAREQTPSTMDSPRKGKAVYKSSGLGRAATPAASTSFGSRAGGEESDVDVGEPRPRRKSLSRLLGDRPKEIDSGDSPSRHVQPLQLKEKGGSRGFMASVRRISLVGRHRRSKSGGTGLTLSNLSEGQQLAPPPPISVTPVLPLLPTSTSQLSLRLPSSSSTSNSHPTMYVGGSRCGSMHDLLSSMRMTSIASSQSQGSSIIPTSSVSAGSSRRASSIHHDLPNQQTPTAPRRRGASQSSARSRTSEDGTGPKRRSSASRSTSDSAGQFAKSKGKEREESGRTPTTPSKLPPPLLSPIELQPPSPPRRSTMKGNPDLSKVVKPTVLSSFKTSALSPTSSSTSVFFTPTASPTSFRLEIGRLVRSRVLLLDVQLLLALVWE